MKTTNNDFNLIMESWRKYADTAAAQPFPLLEQYERKELTEAQLVEAWERDLLLEMQEVFNEGMADTLKQGVAALAAGAKEEWSIIKGAFTAAMKKINDFLATLVYQALELIRKTKEFLQPVADIISKVWGKIKVFCSSHQKLCKAVVIVLVMLAAICLMAASAHAGEVTQGGVEVDQAGLDALKGALYKLGEADMKEEVAAKAIQLIEQAQRAEAATELSTVVGETGNLIREANGLLEAGAAGGEPGAQFISSLSDLGSRITMKMSEWGLEATVAPK
tara:strand:+ start:160 stop:993 length:834 start_codon:yes stop_codon:yes gene_type:complete